MDFFVNGQKLDITLENEKTVGDVLRAFENNAALNDATTIGIKLNGERVPAEDFDDVASRPIEECRKIELDVISKSDIITSLKGIKKESERLAGVLTGISTLYQGGKEKEANASIVRLAETLEEFCHIMTLSCLFPDINKRLVFDGKRPEEFFKEAAPIISDFEKSLESHDTVTTGDLCEYELVPRLELIADAIGKCLQ